MNWILYDSDFQRSKQLATILLDRYRIEALPYQEVQRFLARLFPLTILLVHCDAVTSEFYQLAKIMLGGCYHLRFYCTDEKDRIPQVMLVPDDLEKLIAHKSLEPGPHKLAV